MIDAHIMRAITVGCHQTFREGRSVRLVRNEAVCRVVVLVAESARIFGVQSNRFGLQSKSQIHQRTSSQSSLCLAGR